MGERFIEPVELIPISQEFRELLGRQMQEQVIAGI